MPDRRKIWYVGVETKREKYVILVGCSIFELNQRRNIFCLNFGCLKCWVMFGDIEYNIYFWWCQGGERYDIFLFIGEIMWIGKLSLYILIAW